MHVHACMYGLLGLTDHVITAVDASTVTIHDIIRDYLVR